MWQQTRFYCDMPLAGSLLSSIGGRLARWMRGVPAAGFWLKRDIAPTVLLHLASLDSASSVDRNCLGCRPRGQGSVIGNFAAPLPNTRSLDMSWEIDAEAWKQVRTKLKSRWGKLNEAALVAIDSKREGLVSKLEQLYELSPEEAEKQVKSFESHTKELRPKVAA
jgi:uncharacterized protein YjbJ (UPF0337 family)